MLLEAWIQRTGINSRRILRHSGMIFASNSSNFCEADTCLETEFICGRCFFNESTNLLVEHGVYDHWRNALLLLHQFFNLHPNEKADFFVVHGKSLIRMVDSVTV
jgi:hypothetical protein